MKRLPGANVSLIVVLAFVSLISFGLPASTEGAESQEVIRVIFSMDPATIEYDKNGVAKSVFKYDPRKGIRQGLKEAGFEVVAEDNENYDLTLRITHRERARQTGSYIGDTSHKIMIDRFEFVLEDKDGLVLLKEARGPFGTYDSMTEVKNSLIEELPNLIIGRLQAEDEVSFLVTRLEQEGFKKYIMDRLSELADPRAIEGLVPLLRYYYGPSRCDVKFILMDLGYEPQTAREKAAFDIVNLVRPFSRPTASLEQKSVKTIVLDYGLSAIELFLEDLKCEIRKNYYEGDAVSKNAKEALSLLTIDNLVKWGKYSDPEEIDAEDPDWNTYAVTQLINALNEENEDVKDKDRYLKDVIEILGKIADVQAVDPLENYLTYPELAEAAEKAIEAIEQREK